MKKRIEGRNTNVNLVRDSGLNQSVFEPHIDDQTHWKNDQGRDTIATYVVQTCLMQNCIGRLAA